jgi:hypothetical protein
MNFPAMLAHVPELAAGHVFAMLAAGMYELDNLGHTSKI